MSIFGRAYEYIIRNQEDEVRFYKSDPRNTFIIYDTSVEKNSLMAIRYWKVATEDSVELTEVESNIYYVDVITDQATYFYEANSVTNLELSKRNHQRRIHSVELLLQSSATMKNVEETLRRLFPLLTYMMKRNQIQLTI